jgi:hypothetical protein
MSGPTAVRLHAMLVADMSELLVAMRRNRKWKSSHMEQVGTAASTAAGAYASAATDNAGHAKQNQHHQHCA